MPPVAKKRLLSDAQTTDTLMEAESSSVFPAKRSLVSTFGIDDEDSSDILLGLSVAIAPVAEVASEPMELTTDSVLSLNSSSSDPTAAVSLATATQSRASSPSTSSVSSDDSSSRSVSIEPFAQMHSSKFDSSSKTGYYFHSYSDVTTDSESEIGDGLDIAPSKASASGLQPPKKNRRVQKKKSKHSGDGDGKRKKKKKKRSKHKSSKKSKKSKRKSKKKKKKKKSSATTTTTKAAAIGRAYKSSEGKPLAENPSIVRFADGMHECLRCGKRVKSSSGIKAHFLRLHAPSGLPYECPHCHWANTSQCSVNKHMEKHLLNEALPFVCEYNPKDCSGKCNARFKTDVRWRDHCTATHGFHMPDGKWHSYDQVIAFNKAGLYAASDVNATKQKLEAEAESILKAFQRKDQLHW